MKWLVIAAICAVCFTARPASAQEQQVPIPPIPKVDVSGPYLWGLGGHEIIYVKASADGYNPYMRCALFDARTVEILNRTQAPPLRPSDIHVVNRGGHDWIVVRRFLLAEVKPEDVRAEGMSADRLAQKWAQSVRRALPDVAPRPGRFGI